MTKDSFPVYLAFDCHAVFFLRGWGAGSVAEGDVSFETLLLRVTSRGRHVFCKDFYVDVFQKIQKMEGQWREQTDAGAVELDVGETSCMISLQV